MDLRLYLCSKCCQRCLWDELSDQEHRCQRCRLPDKGCIICCRRFEPREVNEQHCKRCDFHVVRHVTDQTPPPPLSLELEQDSDAELELAMAVPRPVPPPYERDESPIRQHSVAQRWEQIKQAIGI